MKTSKGLYFILTCFVALCGWAENVPQPVLLVERSEVGEPFFQEHRDGTGQAPLEKMTSPIATQGDSPQGSTLWPVAPMNTYEQLMLELINRARANPGAEASRLGIDLNQGLSPGAIEDTPKQPLAPNPQLLQAARLHSVWMLDTNTFSHTGENGSSVSERIGLSGYPLSGSWTTGENIAWGGSSASVNWLASTIARHEGLFISPGHRQNICHNGFEEIGVGIVEGMFNQFQALMVTQKYARSGGTPGPFLTGVVYYDFDGESFYQVHSGLEGIRVSLENGEYHTFTNPGGGYALPFQSIPQVRELEFFDGIQSVTLSVPLGGNQNIKRDLVLPWVPTEVAGPGAIPLGHTSSYTVGQIFGAEMYQISVEQQSPAESDSPVDLSRMEDGTSESYSALSTSVAHTGTGSYRFAHPDFQNQFLTYTSSFMVGENASLGFYSRLGWATSNQQATIQVSADDGRSWETIWFQKGNDGAGDSTFRQQTISLHDFTGERLRIRLAYLFLGGSAYTGTTNTIGWFVDHIQFTNLSEIDPILLVDLDPEEAFEFAPGTMGHYYLSSRPVLGEQTLPWGPRLEVEVISSSAPTISSHPSDLGVTAPAPATFTVEAHGTQLSHQWQRSTNNGATWSNLSGANSATYNTGPTTTAMDGYRYRVVVSNSAGSVTSNPATLSVNAQVVSPNITSHPANQSVTAPDGATFSVSATGTAPLAYQWQRSTNNGATWSNLSGAASVTYNTGPTTTAMDGYRYRVVVSNSAGSVTSNPATLEVLPDDTSSPSFAAAFDAGNHRKYLDWFGWYNDEHWPWIWDYEFSCWLWVVDNGPDNIWFWHHNQQSWMWTRTDWYPWVWFPGSPGLTWRTE